VDARHKAGHDESGTRSAAVSGCGATFTASHTSFARYPSPQRETKGAHALRAWNKISSGAENAAQGDGAGLAVSAANDAEAMEHAALRGAPRLCGAGAVQSARLLARLRQRALPPGAMLPVSASLLLGSQAGDDARGMGESGRGLPAAAGAAVDRNAEGFGGAVAVLKASRMRRAFRNASCRGPMP